MSVGIYIYEGRLEDPNNKLIFNKNLASERMYHKYIDIAIKECGIKVFRDGAAIKKCDMPIIFDEIDKISLWIKENVTGSDREYFYFQFDGLKESIKEHLLDDEDILYIF